MLKGKCPLQVLLPDGPLFHIPRRVFGCVCFIHIPQHQRDTLDPRAVKGIFVRYSNTQKGYKCHVPEKGGKFFVTMDVTFFEDVPFYSSKGKEILEPDRQGEPPTLVQDVSLPSYPSSRSPISPSPKLLPSENDHAHAKTPPTPLPMKVYSRKRTKFEPLPTLSTLPSEVPVPETETCNQISEPSDLDLPIASRKSQHTWYPSTR